MPTTMNDIREWLKEYNSSKYSHVLIVTDTFDYGEFPVGVEIGEDVAKEIDKNNSKEEMKRVMEVYNLSMDIEEQVTSHRVWNVQPYVKPAPEHKGKSSWDLTWMSIALHYANMRSVDPATRHGCIIVSENNKPLSMGYNSFPADCEDDKLPLTRPEKYEVIVHSETNAIINAERNLEGATAYITGFPCPRCFGNMINAKISRIVYGPVGSHQLRDSDMELIEKMNISAQDKLNKIEIIKFSDIADLDDLCGSYDDTRNYTKSKMESKELING